MTHDLVFKKSQEIKSSMQNQRIQDYAKDLKAKRMIMIEALSTCVMCPELDTVHGEQGNRDPSSCIAVLVAYN